MIPDHLVYRAAAGIDQFLAELQRGDWDNYSDLLARAVLEAVAADIWDEGYEACEDDVSICTNWNTETPNPYRASETA